MSTVLDNRIPVNINVDANTGDIDWDKRLVDHNSDAFYRGKTVSNAEFNDCFVRHSYQNNYLADTIEQLLNGGKLKTAVSGAFRSEFNLKPSYVKIFGATDWGARQADGYYYITIPASEHGFAPGEGSTALETMNIDTEMYILSNGEFYEVTQVNTATDNTVTIYTDDPTSTGFVVIRFNDKSYTLQEATIQAAQVVGLAQVAYDGRYSSLTGRNVIEDRVTSLETLLTDIISDTVGQHRFVYNADYATDADTAVHLAGENSSINNIPVSNIFETQSSVVKNATNATNATKVQNVDFSADSQAIFGNYTVVKRRLLWSGDIDLADYVNEQGTELSQQTNHAVINFSSSIRDKLLYIQTTNEDGDTVQGYTIRLHGGRIFVWAAFPDILAGDLQSFGILQFFLNTNTQLWVSQTSLKFADSTQTWPREEHIVAIYELIE